MNKVISKICMIVFVVVFVTMQADISSASHVGVDDDPMMRDPSATVTLIEFADFEGLFSRRFWDETLPLIKQDFIQTGEINYVFRDLPLPIHQYAFKAAEASECADEQGKYWSYHDFLFEYQSDWRGSEDIPSVIDTFKEYADILGLDTKRFDICIDSGKMAPEVQNDYDDGLEAGVPGIPTFFVQNICGDEEMIIGTISYDVLEQALIESLESCNTDASDVASTENGATEEKTPIIENGFVKKIINNVKRVSLFSFVKL